VAVLGEGCRAGGRRSEARVKMRAKNPFRGAFGSARK